MTLFKFHADDIFINTVEGYPEFRFIIHSGSVIIDDVPDQAGANLSNALDVTDGHISLYERNIDKPSGQKQYAYMPKAGYRQSFKIYNEAQHNVWFNYDGELITSSYNHSASVSTYYYAANADRPRVRAVRNACERNKFFSPHYAWEGDFGNKLTQDLRLVSIPSILYGQRIKKGTVRLRFYVGGELLGELTDSTRKGELIQSSGSIAANDGKVAGVVLYDEGVFVITGSWDLDDRSGGSTGQGAIDYVGNGSSTNSKWIYFGAMAHSPASINSGNGIPLTALSASFVADWQGVNHVQTMTMMAHAKYGELNHSNNPTYVTTTSPNNAVFKSGSLHYTELEVPVKNIVDTNLTDHVPAFDKETYITKVAIYDERKNLIGIAKVAVPVRKTEDRQYTFKLKLDI